MIEECSLIRNIQADMDLLSAISILTKLTDLITNLQRIYSSRQGKESRDQLIKAVASFRYVSSITRQLGQMKKDLYSALGKWELSVCNLPEEIESSVSKPIAIGADSRNELRLPIRNGMIDIGNWSSTKAEKIVTIWISSRSTRAKLQSIPDNKDGKIITQRIMDTLKANSRSEERWVAFKESVSCQYGELQAFKRFVQSLYEFVDFLTYLHAELEKHCDISTRLLLDSCRQIGLEPKDLSYLGDTGDIT